MNVAGCYSLNVRHSIKPNKRENVTTHRKLVIYIYWSTLRHKVERRIIKFDKYTDRWIILLDTFIKIVC